MGASVKNITNKDTQNRFENNVLDQGARRFCSNSKYKKGPRAAHTIFYSLLSQKEKEFSYKIVSMGYI
jgi:hypothetical protein